MIHSTDSSNTIRVLSRLCILIFIALAAGSCTEKPAGYFQGYVEGEYVLVSSPLAGRLELLAVSRGQDVAMGDQLFILEHDREQAAVAEAEQGVARAKNILADLEKGKRPSELSALEARLKQARFTNDLARDEFERRQLLFRQDLIPQEEFDRARTEMVERMELAPYYKQLAGTLSGGWKQRLALSACLLHKPNLLLLDEPTAGVDPKARRDFWDKIYNLAAEGVTALISTHYMDEAERCHRLAYLAYGNMLVKGTADEVIASSGLTTWSISGSEVHLLNGELKELDGVEQVVPFGNILHVSGHDADTLRQSLESFVTEKYNLQKTEVNLEDVFISLMQQHKVQ